MSKLDLYAAEIEKIYNDNGGLVDPAMVVETAKDESNPLHDYFQWDNNKAANQYRLWQARNLIQEIRVVKIPGQERTIRAFVSLERDRGNGGYRKVVDVLSNKQLHAEMLREALEQLEIFKRKYQDLAELTPVFEAIKKVTRKEPVKKACVVLMQPALQN